MNYGVSKQVIMISGGSKDLFEQAIFILKDACVEDGVGYKDLLNEARHALKHNKKGKWPSRIGLCILSGAGGFLLCCGLWLILR